MVRVQIQLQDDQLRRLRKWAQERSISVSEAVRRCVAERLSAEECSPSREELIRAALSVCGKYSDPEGRSDVGVNHDRYLDEAYRG